MFHANCTNWRSASRSQRPGMVLVSRQLSSSRTRVWLRGCCRSLPHALTGCLQSGFPSPRRTVRTHPAHGLNWAKQQPRPLTDSGTRLPSPIWKEVPLGFFANPERFSHSSSVTPGSSQPRSFESYITLEGIEDSQSSQSHDHDEIIRWFMPAILCFNLATTCQTEGR